MGFDVKGLSELEGSLSALAQAVGNDGAVIERALRAGAAPIEEQMLANASSDPKMITGNLHDSIHTYSVQKKRGGSGKQITIGVKRSERGAYYAVPVEYGHGGPAPAPAHPYVRPAFDTRYPDACSEMKRVLRDEIKL